MVNELESFNQHFFKYCKKTFAPVALSRGLEACVHQKIGELPPPQKKERISGGR